MAPITYSQLLALREDSRLIRSIIDKVVSMFQKTVAEDVTGEWRILDWYDDAQQLGIIDWYNKLDIPSFWEGYYSIEEAMEEFEGRPDKQPMPL